MQPLRADTITEVTIGPAVAVGDGFTPVTNLVGSSADEFELIKHGATTTTTITGTLAAITGADGYYALDLSATDTNTEGRLTLLINDDSLILPIRHELVVMNQNAYDALYAVAGTLLNVNTAEISGSASAADNLELGANTLESGACEGTPTTTVIQTNLAETQDDIYIGRVMIFTGGNARGEATHITDYTGSTGTCTVGGLLGALSNAPANTDPFILV